MNSTSRIVILSSLSLGVILAVVGLWRLTQNQSPQPDLSTLLNTDQIHSTSAAPAMTPGLMPVSAAAPVVSAEAKVALLDEILASHNDNDPRLDQELRHLDGDAKNAIQKRYAVFAPERRNERGTIVFLLGRNLTDARDFHFMKEVVAEAPCLSLGNCSKQAEAGDPHLESASEVTLAYPQLVALKQIENFLKNKGNRIDLIQEARKVIEAAKGSKNPSVTELALELEKRL